MGPGSSNNAGVLKNEITDSEESDLDEVEFLDGDAVERPWSPLLQPEPPSRRKEKQKRGASDVSRDQVSCEGSVGSGGIEEEEEEEEEAEEEEAEEEEEELKGMPDTNDNPSLFVASLTYFTSDIDIPFQAGTTQRPRMSLNTSWCFYTHLERANIDVSTLCISKATHATPHVPVIRGSRVPGLKLPSSKNH